MGNESLPRDFKNLKAWEVSVDLVAEVYGVTMGFPSQEQFGLTNQLRRAAVSIPSNIAEGYARGSRKEYVHFLKIARGSLAEVETQMIIAQRLAYVQNSEAIRESLQQCYRLLHGLIRSLSRDDCS